MKARIKQWKRIWRMLEKGDRGMFTVYGWYTLAMIACSFVVINMLINALWAIILMFFTWVYIRHRRITQYRYFHEGRYHQLLEDRVKTAQLWEAVLEMNEIIRKQNSDYKKLEYDYNQLKKSINPKKKKK